MLLFYFGVNMKKILFCIFIILSILGIYFKYNIKETSTLCFSSRKKCNFNYLYKDTRIEDIINDIENNITINGKTILNILVKSKYIYIDLNNLYLNKNSYTNIDRLLSLIRKYTKEKIVVILCKKNDISTNNMNKWIFKLREKYDIIITR